MPIEVKDWQQSISTAKYDSTAGIRISTLFEDEASGSYVTEIAPGKYVNPHYHKNGTEEYHIISGEGVLKTALVNESGTVNEISTDKVREGNSFMISPKTIHQLINTGNLPLFLLFSCPPSHLKEDRFIYEGFNS